MPSLSVIWYVYSQCKTELVMDRLQLTRSLPGSHKHRDNYYPMLSQLLDSQTNHRCSDINLEHFLTCRCFELLLCQASGFFCKAAGWCVSVVTSVDWLTGWFVGCYTNWFIIGVMRTLFGIPIYQPGSVFVGGFPESSPRRPNDFFQFSHLVCDQLSRTQTFLKISLVLQELTENIFVPNIDIDHNLPLHTPALQAFEEVLCCGSPDAALFVGIQLPSAILSLVKSQETLLQDVCQIIADALVPNPNRFRTRKKAEFDCVSHHFST